MTVDALKYATKLEEIGVPREQAKAQAEALRDAVEGEVATKSDMEALELRLMIKLGALMTTLVGLSTGILAMLIT